jgi:hypothetical protein
VHHAGFITRIVRDAWSTKHKIRSDRIYSLNYSCITCKEQHLQLVKPPPFTVQLNNIRAFTLLYWNWFFAVFDITLCILAVWTLPHPQPQTKKLYLDICSLLRSQVCTATKKSCCGFFLWRNIVYFTVDSFVACNLSRRYSASVHVL